MDLTTIPVGQRSVLRTFAGRRYLYDSVIWETGPVATEDHISPARMVRNVV